MVKTTTIIFVFLAVRYVGSSFPTRDGKHAPCTGSMES